MSFTLKSLKHTKPYIFRLEIEAVQVTRENIKRISEECPVLKLDDFSYPRLTYYDKETLKSTYIYAYDFIIKHPFKEGCLRGSTSARFRDRFKLVDGVHDLINESVFRKYICEETVQALEVDPANEESLKALPDALITHEENGFRCSFYPSNSGFYNFSEENSGLLFTKKGDFITIKNSEICYAMSSEIFKKYHTPKL